MSGFLKIEFPEGRLQTRATDDHREVFDPVRKLWVVLTPEEWVRQHFIRFLLFKKYPPGLIAVEKKIILGELTKRCDIVIYSRSMNPFMIVECKEMKVRLSQKVLEQILRYNIALQPSFLIITNGEYTLGFERREGKLLPLAEFPEYE